MILTVCRILYVYSVEDDLPYDRVMVDMEIEKRGRRMRVKKMFLTKEEWEETSSNGCYLG